MLEEKSFLFYQVLYRNQYYVTTFEERKSYLDSLIMENKGESWKLEAKLS